MSVVAIHAYDAEWPHTFARLHAHVWPHVQHAALRMEHVGSTSVPGLRAKAVIDACIVVASPRDIPHVVKALATLGYVHRGDQGVPGREAFKAPSGLPAHHLYASHHDSLSLKNQLGLRDYLRANPDAAHAYGELKDALATQFPDAMNCYSAGKTEFLLNMLRMIGLADDELAAIRAMNQPEAPVECFPPCTVNSGIVYARTR